MAFSSHTVFSVTGCVWTIYHKHTYRSHSIQVTAQADQALLTVPATTVTGDEDTAIAIPDLSVTPVDTDGSEVLSATLSGLPSGTLLSHGENNGDGSWVIPVNELSLLTVTPPLNFAGTMSLALNAYTLELSNGDEAVATQGFTVEVSPVADSYLIVAHDVSTDALGKATLDLSLRLLDDNGDSAGELPAELVQLTLDNLPTGARVLPGLGGTLSHSGQSATFVGSEDQANNLFIVTGPGTAAGSYQVSISGITIDNGSVLADPVLDSFKLTVGSPTGAGQTYTGTTVANNLSGSSGNDEIDAGTGDDTLSAGAGYDYLIGGPGLDTMTGGSETDVYGWSTGDLGSEVDRITDFVAGVGGDILDLHALWDTAYDWQASDISSFVQLGGDAGGIVVAVDTSGAGASFQDLVLLEGVTGVTVETMLANGNILV
jgi:Ca2+-binding RTX toxin-like protein